MNKKQKKYEQGKAHYAARGFPESAQAWISEETKSKLRAIAASKKWSLQDLIQYILDSYVKDK